MKMTMTEEQLLLLDNLMYLQGSSNGKFQTVGDLITYYNNNNSERLTSDDLSGGFESEEGMKNFTEILNAISEDETLMNLGIGESIDGEVRATCFIQYDASGNEVGHTVAFRGTGGIYEAWHDNFEGMYQQDTKAQIKAKEYIESLGYDDITVTGHSKGGNLAMYVTVLCEEQIQSCVSFDGQGFGDKFLENYKEQIANASGKIKSVSAYNDFVNILLTSIAGTNLYFPNEGTGANAHSSYYLYLTNADALDAHNGIFTEDFMVEQDEVMILAHEALMILLDVLPEDNAELIADVVGAIVAHVLSGDANGWKTVSDIVGDILEYNFLQGHRWTNPVQKVFKKTWIGIIVGLVLAGVKVHNNWDEIMEMTEILAGRLEDLKAKVGSMIRDAYKRALAYLEKLKGYCKQKLVEAKENIADFVNYAGRAAENANSRIRDYSIERLQSLLDIIEAFETIPFFDINIWGSKYAGETWFGRLSLDGVQRRLKAQYATVTQENENSRSRILAVFDEIESIDTQYAGKIKSATGELRQIKAQLKLI